VSLLDPERAENASRGHQALALEIVCLGFTGWCVWQASMIPVWHRLSPAWLAGLSVGYTLGAWLLCATLTLGLYLLFQQWDGPEMIQAALRTSAAAVWFAPAAILLSVLSPVALAAALFLVIRITRLLYSEWRWIHLPAELPSLCVAETGDLFAAYQVASPFLLKQLAPGLAASVCMQVAALATMFRLPFLAACAAGSCIALLTVFTISSGLIQAEPARSPARSILGALLAMLMAVGVTLGGSSHHLLRGAGMGNGTGAAGAQGVVDSTRALVSRLLPPPKGVPDASRRVDSFSGILLKTGAGLGDGGFPGVILWPVLRPIATLVAPPPVASGHGASFSRPREALSIPFSGEYWLFRRPYEHPPPTSHFQRGSPATLAFRTTDRKPMQMEAYHRFAQPIALACCSRVGLEIRNADLYPGTISLELLLLDTSRPGSPQQSLGSIPVRSTPNLRQDHVAAVPETLEFAIPANATLREFDAVRVVFRRDSRRADKSARIAIDRIILVP
jgi:hypothetical protein